LWIGKKREMGRETLSPYMSFFDQRATLFEEYSMTAIRTSDPEYAF
jgi:hypothetical protein